MFWNMLNISRKLFLIFLVSTIFLLSIFFALINVFSTLLEQSDVALTKAIQTINLTARESDHIQWISRLNRILEALPTAVQITSPELPSPKCQLGQWLAGQERVELEKLAPSWVDLLGTLEPAHTALHASGEAIMELCKQGRTKEARELFENQTLTVSRQITTAMHNLRSELEVELQLERQRYMVRLEDVKLGVTLTAIPLALGCLLIWILISRMVVTPLRRIAAVCAQVSQGDMRARVRLNRKDEIGQIADTHDHMLTVLSAKMRESETRIQEVMHLDGMLKATNEMARILLSGDESGFDDAMWEALQQMGCAAQVDRVYVWGDRIGDDQLRYCDQLYEWSGGATPQQERGIVQNISYTTIIPRWMEAFANDQCLSGPVREMPAIERPLLEQQEILSLLVAPISLDEEAWGFIGMDDCHHERIWTSSEEHVLRAAGVLVATAIRRYRLISALKMAKEKAEDATSAKSEFLARMSHEIRTPMNAILGLTYLSLQLEMNPTLHGHLGRIRTAASNLLSILNDILDFSKIEARKLELEDVPFNLKQEVAAVLDVVTIRAREKGIGCTCCIAPNVPLGLCGDATRIRQILLNLAGNAVKFTESGGIRVEVDVFNLGRDTVTLCFSVEDSGIGLSPSELGRLFSPFTQSDGSISRRYGGTGLGLVICKELVEMMGGHMMVESEPGRGSTFTCTLTLKIALNQEGLGGQPCQLEKKNQTDLTAQIAQNTGLQHNASPDAELLPSPPPGFLNKEKSLDGKRVLLVEDNEINQMIAAAILEQVGMVVTTANNGLESLRVVQEQVFDIVLMDIQMPEMDGLEATRHIRTMTNVPASLPILAMTAHAMSSDYAKSMEAGMNDHITKPIDPDQLYAMLRRWV